MNPCGFGNAASHSRTRDRRRSRDGLKWGPASTSTSRALGLVSGPGRVSAVVERPMRSRPADAVGLELLARVFIVVTDVGPGSSNGARLCSQTDMAMGWGKYSAGL